MDQFRGALWASRVSLALLLIILAWAPFPLGSNRPWSWSLLCLLITSSWLFWFASVWSKPWNLVENVRGLVPALAFAVLALGWAIVQVLPIVPADWSHPVWQLASDVLGVKLSHVISLNPWRSQTELMKLAAYAMTAWLARCHAGRQETARLLLRALIGIGAFYALYALAMYAYGASQLGVFYEGTTKTRDLSGPFVNHNSFATYAGMLGLCAAAWLVFEGGTGLHFRNGLRRWGLLLLQYLVGRGAPYLAAAFALLAAVIATGSRAGNFAMVMGALSLLAMGAAIVRHGRARWLLTATVLIGAALITLFALNGDKLAGRLNDMTTVGVSDDTRFMLWGAATHMIKDAPLLGLGLGTFENAYPMYADTTLPLIIDKVHDDYLELAAGWGLPATLLWLSAMGLLVFRCLDGVRNRQRNRVYPALAVGVTALVGVHAIFDFSLQMPAVAVTYAAIMGIGVAQSYSSREAGHLRARTSSSAGIKVMRLAVLAPALLVGGLAAPRFISGLAQDAALPVTSRMLINQPLTTKSYRRTSAALAHTALTDGESQILRAWAVAKAGGPAGDVVPTLEIGLADSPASALGWILLAQEVRPQDRKKAAAALSLALLLAPHEHFLEIPRVLAGAPLWDSLSSEAHQLLLTDARALLERPDAGPALQDLLAEPGGRALVGKTFIGHPESLRAFNRALQKKRLGI